MKHLISSLVSLKIYLVLALLITIILVLTGSPSRAFAQAQGPTFPPINQNLPTPTPITPTPTPIPSSTPTPTSPPATSAPAPTNTPTPTPKPTLRPTVRPTIGVITEITETPTEEPEESPTPSPDETPTPAPKDNQNTRSAMVASISGPKDIPFSPELLFLSLLTTGFLVLLIMFPAELFNATVQSNYEEIMRWSLIHRIKTFYDRMNHLPALIVVIGFAILGAIINSFLSPDFGFNQPTFALILGLLIALFVITLVYDITRKFYMKKRFGVSSKLRAHSLGLFTGSLLVAVSRLANFLPGYCYGIFTGLVYKHQPEEKEDGEGIAISAILLLVVAIIGWFSWVPIKEAAMGDNPSFLALVIDAAIATLWVSALTATVFGLMPLRFMYGEVVMKWNFAGWAIIYITGVYLFVYTLLNPAIGIYGKSDKASWAAVLSLFFAFGIFSILFWGYFRYRHLFGFGPKT
jgi:hypothetical protein